MTRISLAEIINSNSIIAYVIIHYDANSETETVLGGYTEAQKSQLLNDLNKYRKGNSGAADWFRIQALSPVDESALWDEVEKQQEAKSQETTDSEKRSKQLHAEMAAHFKVYPDARTGKMRFVRAYTEQERDCIELTLTFEKAPSYSGTYILENNCGFVSLYFQFEEHNRITFLQKDDANVGFALPVPVYKGLLNIIKQHYSDIAETIDELSIESTRIELRHMIEEMENN